MISASSAITKMINAPVRRLVAEVELYQGSTLVETFKNTDRLVNFTIERVVEENKFFGVGICQHLKVDILDKERAIDYITTEYSLKVKMGIEGDLVYPFPTFFVTQTRRNEKTNALSIYGYDLLKRASGEKIGSFVTPTDATTVKAFADACALGIGTSIIVKGLGSAETCFDTQLPEGVNFDGSEALREAFNDVAEVTQTIYYIDNQDKLVFKRLQKTPSSDYIIDKSKYFTLETKNNKRLSKIQHSTALNDNVYAKVEGLTGTTQFVRDNGIWTALTSIGPLLQSAIDAVGAMTIAQFDCSWRGNFLLEVGDKLALVNKDNTISYSFLLDDTLEYDGAFTQKSKWEYNDDTSEEGGNSVTLGEKLSQTFAKVDKAAGEIELVAKKTDELEEMVGSIVIDAEAITSTVQRVEKLEEESQTFKSEIQQTADELALKVSKDDIISAINLSPETIVISSQKIDMQGVVTFSDLENEGATVINGSNITTGTISAERLNLSGAITFSDLNGDTQDRIENVENTASEAYHLALQAGNGVTLPGYIKSSYIDSAEIRSPTITGNDIQVYNTFQSIGYDGTQAVVSGYMGAARGMDGEGNTTFGVALSNDWSSDSYNVGDNYVIVTNGGVRLQAGSNRITVTSGAINITTENGKAYYNGVEISRGSSGESAVVVPVWG